MVTGGNGLHGKEARPEAPLRRDGTPSKVVILSRDEAKQHVMRLAYMERQAVTEEVIYENFRRTLSFRIGDVRSYPDVCAAMRDVDSW